MKLGAAIAARHDHDKTESILRLSVLADQEILFVVAASLASDAMSSSANAGTITDTANEQH
jgi:hypothetical protein